MNRNRIFALIMALVTCFTLCIPCFAMELPRNEPMALAATEAADIYQALDGTLLLESGGEYHVVEKTDVPLSSEAAVSQVLGDESLPIEVREDIEEKYNILKENGMTNTVSLHIYDDMGLYNPARGGVDDYPVYREYNGHQMKSIVTSWTDMNQPTEIIYEGKTTYPTASQLTDIALSLGSFVEKSKTWDTRLAIFGLGKTLWSIYQESKPIKKTTASLSDFVELSFTYDFYQKYVFVYSTSLEVWEDALEAQKAVIKDPFIRACFMSDDGYSGGRRIIDAKGQKVPVVSLSYDNPWETASNHIFFKLIEDIDATIGNYNFVFGDFRY